MVFASVVATNSKFTIAMRAPNVRRLTAAGPGSRLTAAGPGSRCFASRNSVPYSEHQASLGRPISPHVTIYKQPIPAMSSIANRITGILLAVGFAGVGAVAAAGYDVPAVIGRAQESVPGFERGAKFLVAFPLAVHGIGGVRHLMWDRAPEKITYSYATRSSKLMCASSFALAIAATAITIQSPVPRGSSTAGS